MLFKVHDSETEKKVLPSTHTLPSLHNAPDPLPWTRTHSVFVICHITEDVVEIQNSSISMFQSMHLYPVVWILYESIWQISTTKRERNNLNWGKLLP